MLRDLRISHTRALAIGFLCTMLIGGGLEPCTCSHQAAAGRTDDRQPAGTATPLKQTSRETVRLEVRVVDTAGHAVSNATARAIVLIDEKDFQTETIAFDGTKELIVSTDGRLLTPPLEFDKAYVLQIDAPGMLSGLSHWSRSPDRGTVKLPDVVLRRLLTVPGRVVTRDNQPLGDVKVIQSGDGPQRTETTTDLQGRFAIAGVPEGGAFLFAEKEGYAFHGQPVAAEKGPVQIVLERTNDPQRRKLRSLAPPKLALTRAERLDLAFQVLKPRLSHRLDQKPPQADFWLMRELAHASLPAAHNYFDVLVAAGISQADRDQQIEEIANAVVLSDPAEALALIQRISNPDARWSVLSYLPTQLKLCTLHAPADEGRITDRLAAETAFAARPVADPFLRVAALGNIAASRAGRGKPEEAAVLLDEAQEALQGLDPTVHKWHFARVARLRILCSRDPDLAQLGAIRQDGDFWRLFAEMQIARRRPREAESLLADTDLAALFREERTGRPQRPPLYCISCTAPTSICIQVAAIDGACAERMAHRIFESLKTLATPAGQDDRGASATAGAEPGDLISDVEVALLKAVTLARIAERVVAADRYQARQWLDEAVDGLTTLRGSKYRDGWFHAPAAVMATLVPLAEQIDPALADEVFWRSLALRVPRSPGDGRMQRAEENGLATQARLLARYDLSVARQLLSPLVENNRGEFLTWSPGNNVQIRVDCDALRAKAHKFTETPFDESRLNYERLRLDVAERLAAVQNQIERDGPGFFSFELELIREQIGHSFHHPRLEE